MLDVKLTMTKQGSVLPLLTAVVLFISCLQAPEQRLSANNQILGLFHHKLHTCRYPARSQNQKITGYNCPHFPPTPYASSNKYAPNVRWKYSPSNPPDVIYGCGSPPITTVFCRGEILQLQLDIPENISNETAVTAYYGLAPEAPYFCPESFSTHTHHGKYDYCPSQACRQRLPFRTNKPDLTYANFGTAGNIWVLNITLLESPGRYGLTMRTVSCPPDSCKLWKGISTNPKCCSSGTNFDLILLDKERNSFKSPATHSGDKTYNVTLYKSGSFIELDVNNTANNHTIESFATAPGIANIELTLPLGVYQVSGKVSHQCGAEPLKKPITLLPLNATFNPIETLSFSKRKLSWTIESDLPVDHFEFYPQDAPLQKITTNNRSLEFSIEGHLFDTPAPLRRTFVHRVDYTGIDASNDPVDYFLIDLSAFLPSNITVSGNRTSTSLTWNPPEAESEHVSTYRLTVSRTVNNPELMLSVKSSGQGRQNITYTHRQYIADETVHFELGAIFAMKIKQDEHTYWWGPVQPVIIKISASPTGTHPTATVHSTTDAYSTATTRSIKNSHSPALFSTSATASPSTSPDGTSEGKNNLAVILGGTAAGLVSVGVAGTAILAATARHLRRRENTLDSVALFDRAAEIEN